MGSKISGNKGPFNTFNSENTVNYGNSSQISDTLHNSLMNHSNSSAQITKSLLSATYAKVKK